MTVATRRRGGRTVSDEADAFRRVVLALTVGVGGMAAVIGAATGELMLALPTLVLLIALARGAVALAGWSGVIIWLALVPPAHGEAILAPLAMVVLCLAVALGPSRLAGWVGDELTGHRDVETPEPDGWIEEDRRRIG